MRILFLRLTIYILLFPGNKVQKFADKVVIVTGASTGIGRETALAFAAAGAQVVAAARHAAPLQELASDRILAVPTDVTRDDDVRRLVETTLAKFGRVDILVNNAGFGIRATVENTAFEDAHRLMEVNFFGLLRCTQAVLPHMKKQAACPEGIRGQIVNVGSVLSLLATPRNSIYSASKFAVRALSDSLRIELRGAGIDVILIMPGYTDTPFFENQVRYGGPVRVGPIKGVHPRTVARAILRACARRKREAVLTFWGKLGAFLKRWCPRFLDWTLSRSW
jgi:NAD(P)-dependent dehydrogenase (short-subunit alcohol dehydrogenase family)